VRRYVELLDMEDDEDRVLMGEPPLFTQPRYGYLSNFECHDLEWFSTFCGLTLISKQSPQSHKIVEKELLKTPKAFTNLAQWLYRMPKIEHGKSTIMKKMTVQTTTQPQFGEAYEDIVKRPLEFLEVLLAPGSDQKIATLIANCETMPGMIKRLCEISSRDDIQDIEVRELALKVLSALRRYRKPLAEIKKNKGYFKPGTKAEGYKDYNDIKNAIEGNVEMLDEEKSKVESHHKEKENKCVCGKTGPLKSCGRCRVQHYCSAECQKSDWPKHKTNCKAPAVK